MHTVFCVSEIIRRVCELAELDTLANLARSAWILHEPAIQILWTEVPNMVPLLRCFPEDAWELDGEELRFSRALAPKDWTAFLKYSSLVRDFGQDTTSRESPVYTYHSSTWPTMCAFRPTIILFPNLLSLDWGRLGLKDDTFPSFLLSVGQTLEVLHLPPRPPSFDESESSTALRVAFQIIADRFQHLRILFVDMSWAFDRMDSALESAIASLRVSLSSLQSLRCPGVPVTIHAVTALAQLPALSNLTMCLPDDAQWSSFSPSTGHLEPFKRLRTISLITTISAYVTFANSLQLPYVYDVVIALRQYSSEPPSIPDLFLSFRRQFSPSELKLVVISASRGATGIGLASTLGLTILPAYLRPLLDFKHMEDFVLSLHYTTNLDDTLLSDMAMAWPRLRSLSIHCLDHAWATVHSPETLPTIKVMATFAMRCPDVISISLCGVNATCWPTLAEFEGDQETQALLNQLSHSPSPSPLQTLRFVTAPITAPEYVVTFLAITFPALSCVDYNSDWDFQRVGSWWKVSHLLSEIQEYRYQRTPLGPFDEVS
ncbi:hypothetical protein C8Q73DRAFT_763229 [Cubamyces lactineus]|nr:hypothetical protein C8Q73DRAFT_763229 [Cubamyces lactineus]